MIQHKKIWISVILILAFGLRLYQSLLGVPLSSNIWSDMRGYVQLADWILQNNWNENHFFQSIGFPYLIAFLKSQTTDWGLALSLINNALSFFTVILMWKSAEATFGERIGFYSLVIGAFHVPWILLNIYAMPETAFGFLLAVCCFSSIKILAGHRVALYSLLWGSSFIIGFWLKGTHAFLGPLFYIGLYLSKRKTSLIPILLIGIPVVIGLGLHAWLSSAKIGKVQLSASAGGLNFVEGKCPAKKNRDNAGYSWQSALYYQLHLDTEKSWDRPFTDSSYYFQEGLNCIKKDPFVLIQSLEGISFLVYGNTTWPLNQRKDAGAIRLYEHIFTVFLIFGLVFFIRQSWSSFKLDEFFIWSFPILAIFITTYIFKSEMRFRIPFDVWFIPVALKGWSLSLQYRRP